MSLIVAETRKLTTVWTTVIITAVGLLLITIGSAFLVFESEFSGVFVGTDAQVAELVGQIASVDIIVLVVGLLVVTTEFRHETIGRTLQLTPSRTRMLAAKVTVGALYGVLFFVLGLVLVGIFLAVSGASPEFGDETLRALWQGPVRLVLMTTFGVLIGAVLRSQVVAVALMLVYAFMVETLIASFLPALGRWLPIQALQAIFISDELRETIPEGVQLPLEPEVAAVVFLGYLVAIGAAAVVLLRTRDV